MSTANKLSYLNDTKSLLRTSLNKFGSSILSTDTFRSYDTKLNEIYDKLPKVTQSGAGFTITPVQNGQVDDFKMNGTDLEQNTTTGKQLLNIPDGTYSSNGVTAVAKDGVVTLNGTAGGGNSFIKIPFIFNFEDTKTYTLSANNEDVIGGSSYDVSYSAIRFDLSDNNSSIATWCYLGTKNNSKIINDNYNAATFCIRTGAGLTYNNFVIKPQLEEGSSSTSFEPYTGGITSPNPDYPQDIKVVEGRQVITDKGKNLLKLYTNNSSITINDVECSIDNNDTITLNGTASQTTYIEILSNFVGVTSRSSTKYISLDELKIYTLKSFILSGTYTNAPKLNTQYDNQYSEKGEIFGNSISISNSDGLYRAWLRIENGTVLDNLKINIQLEENSTATNYEPYYEPVSYNIDLHGKNVFNLEKYPFTPKVAYSSTGYQELNWTGYSGIKDYFPINGNTTYSFSNSTGLDIYYGLVFYDKNKTIISNITAHTTTFTTPSNCEYIRFSIHTEELPTWVQIEEGSITTNYEEYYDYKLAKMPNTDYKNRIYKNNGNWYFEENAKKVVLDGSEVITIQNIGTDNWYYQLSVNCCKTEQLKQMCSHYKNSGIYNSNTYEGIMMLTDGNFIRIRYGEEDTVANFKAWLSNNNVELWYPLINSITTQITNTTLINQLEAISVHTGTNIITISNSNNIIPEIEITRLKELEKLA